MSLMRPRLLAPSSMPRRVLLYACTYPLTDAKGQQLFVSHSCAVEPCAGADGGRGDWPDSW